MRTHVSARQGYGDHNVSRVCLARFRCGRESIERHKAGRLVGRPLHRVLLAGRTRVFGSVTVVRVFRKFRGSKQDDSDKNGSILIGLAF